MQRSWCRERREEQRWFRRPFRLANLQKMCSASLPMDSSWMGCTWVPWKVSQREMEMGEPRGMEMGVSRGEPRGGGRVPESHCSPAESSCRRGGAHRADDQRLMRGEEWGGDVETKIGRSLQVVLQSAVHMVGRRVTTTSSSSSQALSKPSRAEPSRGPILRILYETRGCVGSFTAPWPAPLHEMWRGGAIRSLIISSWRKERHMFYTA